MSAGAHMDLRGLKKVHSGICFPAADKTRKTFTFSLDFNKFKLDRKKNVDPRTQPGHKRNICT